MKKFFPVLLSIILFTLPISCKSTPPITSAITNCLNKLDSTKYNSNDFDYWPNGGIRNTYNHLSTFITYQDLAKAFGEQVFKSGPHSNEKIILDSNSSFGHYNPKFILWSKDKVKNVLSNKELIQQTKPLFDKYLSQLFLTYYETYLELQKNREWLNSEID